MPRLLTLLTVVASLGAVAPASAANPWLERKVLNMTHQGGENEHPSGTMFAMRESLGLGADMLELDVQPTKDGHLMVLHDQSVARTTGVDRSVYDMTLAEVRKLDAAHNFVPGRGTVLGLTKDSYPLRGVRTGDVSPPLGYGPDDFGIPTLEEMLVAFPDVPMNIEIKGRSDDDTDSFLKNADRLVALLRRVPHPPLVVVSFNQDAVDRFHAALPAISVAPGITGTAAFVLGNVRPVGDALQVPPSLSGVTIMTPDFVRRAHAQELAVHVWFSGQEESPRVYRSMLDMGADGLMPAKPRALEAVLCERRTPRPAGNPNHCGGGPEEATRLCSPRVRSVGRVARDGRVEVALQRTGRTNHACAGTVGLRGAARSGASAVRFLFPYGTDRTRVSVRLSSRMRTKLRRDRRLKAAAKAWADGASRRRTLRRVVLRPAP